MQTTHNRTPDLAVSEAKQSRPTREEILKGIDYQPLVMGEGVPEYVRAAEDRRIQDDIVKWTLDLYDHMENGKVAAAPRKPAKRGPRRVSHASKRQNPRPKRASARVSRSRDRPKRILLKKKKYPSAYFTPGQCALLDMPNPNGYTLGERMMLAKGPRRALLIAEEHQEKVRWFYLSFASDYEFLGATIVRGQGFLTAIQRASDLNINPGGGVISRPLNWRHMKRIPADLRNRLLSGEEVDTRLGVLGG